MAGTARQPEGNTPRAEQRTTRDERGRTWVGSVTSGRLPGGESHAEVVWICEDAPSEAKRFTRLDASAAEADDVWRDMPDREVSEAFGRSEIA